MRWRLPGGDPCGYAHDSSGHERRSRGPRRRDAFRAVGLAFLLLLAPLALAAQDVAVRAGTVHTVSDAGTLEDAVVLIRDGRIVAVGPAGEVEIPDGVDQVHFPSGVLTPGLVNSHSTVGLAGIYNSPEDQDLSESVGVNHADLRALDAFNYKEELLGWIRELGTTAIQVVPGGDGPPIAGQAAVFKTAGDDTEAMLVRAPSAVAFQLGERPKARSGYPSTRMGVAAEIRKALAEARSYAARRGDREADEDEEAGGVEAGEDDEAGDGDDGGRRNLKLEALSRVLDGEVPALFTARREDDILTALRIAREFGLDLVLDGATEAYLVAGEIAAAGIPVIVGPVMEPPGSPETVNVSLENAAILANRGVPVALQSGWSPYVPKTRVLLWEAGMALVNGLGFERTLRSITLDAARILGVDDRVGSLEAGKDGDLVVFDGDPFEYLTHVDLVVIEGEIVHRGAGSDAAATR